MWVMECELEVAWGVGGIVLRGPKLMPPSFLMNASTKQ